MINLTELIELINTEHKLFSEEIAEKVEQINLKKKRIDHFVGLSNIDGELMKSIRHYRSHLSKIYENNLFYMTLEQKDFSLRIKDPSSIVSKIIKYRFKNKEQGKVSINKCLNDLLGFRIILPSYDLKELDQILVSNQIKVHNSSKGNYKATHLYFDNGKNIYYPWELQIWLEKDVISNYSSHSIHKQSYTEWPMEYYQTMKED